jgi:hypothetical protein
MAKIGRNQPCPCGSGKKYKKCCSSKEKSPTSAAPELGDFHSTTDNEDSRSPYVLAKNFERSDLFAEMKRTDPHRARLFWTPSRVAALETSAIVQRLARLGIMTTREDFEVFAESFTSAWSVSNVWLAKFRKLALSRHDDDFLGIAACELWKRYCPDTPSVEMLDDWMQEGYRSMMDQDSQRACDLWSAVWDVVRSRLTTTMRTCDQASSIFDGTQCLFNWIQDYCLELTNASSATPRYATDGIRLCEHVLNQFVDERPLFLRNFRTDLGHFHFLAGNHSDGEQVLREVIRDYPDTAVGYARLADLFAYGVRPGDEPIDPQKAQRVLEEALARPVVDAARFDLENRLQEIRDGFATTQIDRSNREMD